MLKISACAIVKNEEANLPRWLICAKALADEMVIVDTGSTDRTVELAREAGASVYSFEWRKDFAAAKNFALRKGKGDWIVFLDADEYFSEEDIPKVREHIQRLDRDQNVGGFICPWVNIDKERGVVFLYFRLLEKMMDQPGLTEPTGTRQNNVSAVRYMLLQKFDFCFAVAEEFNGDVRSDNKGVRLVHFRLQLSWL